jgi:hypothetical protein
VYEDFDWIELAEDEVQLNTVIKPVIKAGNVLAG